MTGFNHTLAGSIIALSIQQPLLAAPLALISHFVLDMVPHFGNHPKIYPYTKSFRHYLVFDGFMCFAVLGAAIFFAPHLWGVIMLGAFFATLPDFFWIYMDKSPKWAEPFFTFHKDIQWAEVPRGWIYESVYFVFGMLLLYGLGLIA